MPIKIFLSRTPVNCFRSPAVVERIREVLDKGGNAAISTRDHPETLPDGVVHAGDDWSAVAAACPDLAVFDNLVFDEPRGRELRRWDREMGRYVNEPAGALESVLNELVKAGTKEVLLVCEKEEISDGWREWMRRCSVLPCPEAEEGFVARRQWLLSDTQFVVNDPYRYRDGRLLKPAPRDWPRKLEVEILTPAAEALLALTAEYAAVRFDARDPEDPRGLNQRDDMCHEILEAFSGTADPRELLTAVEDLYDIVSQHVDFSRWKPSWEKSTNPGTPDREENDAWQV